MLIPAVRLCVVFVGLVAVVPSVVAQSEQERDGQRAAKLHAEQDVIKELFFWGGRWAHAETSPASMCCATSKAIRVGYWLPGRSK